MFIVLIGIRSGQIDKPQVLVGYLVSKPRRIWASSTRAKNALRTSVRTGIDCIGDEEIECRLGAYENIHQNVFG